MLLVAFFRAALCMLAAAGAAAAANVAIGADRLSWLALHLAFLGGVSQLVLGAGQFFVCAFLATSPPGRPLMRAQLGVWNGGTVLVAVGVTLHATLIVAAGAGLILSGLALFTAALIAMQRRSLQRARWAVRWYQASAAGLAFGALLGIALAGGVSWRYGSLLGAHIALNLAGWIGTAIVGTLHTFFPSLTATQLRFPQLQGATFLSWIAGVGAFAVGAALDLDGLVIAAWVGLLLAAALLGASIAGSLRAALGVPTLPVTLTALAHAFLLAGIIVALVTTISDGASAPYAGSARGAVATLLVGGWIGLTVAGALLQLLALLGRVRRFPSPPAASVATPGRDRAAVAALGAGLSALAVSHAPGLDSIGLPATLVVLAGGGFVAARIATLGLRALADQPLPRTGG